MIRELAGSTRVEVQLTGLPAGLEMMAHVHAASCAYQGGGHYKIDPAVLDTVEENELWIHLLVSAEGVAATSVAFAHLTRGDALSIVLHDPASGGKMACADLEEGDPDELVELEATLAPFAQAEEQDQRIAGGAIALRAPDRTAVVLGLERLDPAQVYGAHVHALPCAVLDAGGHYKIDPTVLDALEENEIWPEVSDYEGGTTVSYRSFAHAVRADAQSIVLHRTAGDAKPKVACGDLVRLDHPALVTGGEATLLPAGEDRTPDLEAAAEMIRTLGDATAVSLEVSGLEPGASYPAHVHDLPCAIQDGGGHYLIDPAAGPAEANEVWLSIAAADDDGAARVETSVARALRPEAQSIVIHDGDDGARLVCIDLE